MLYLLCNFLDLSVVELAEHSPRPFGQEVCGAPLSSFRTWGVAAWGKAGSLLETSRRLEIHIYVYIYIYVYIEREMYLLFCLLHVYMCPNLNV